MRLDKIQIPNAVFVIAAAVAPPDSGESPESMAKRQLENSVRKEPYMVVKIFVLFIST